jgi:hypothetical protein
VIALAEMPQRLEDVYLRIVSDEHESVTRQKEAKPNELGTLTPELGAA